MMKQNVYAFLVLSGMFLFSFVTTPVKASSVAVDTATTYGVYATAATLIYGGYHWAAKKPRKNKETMVEKIARITSGTILAAAGCALAKHNADIQQESYSVIMSRLRDSIYNMISSNKI